MTGLVSICIQEFQPDHNAVISKMNDLKLMGFGVHQWGGKVLAAPFLPPPPKYRCRVQLEAADLSK